MASEEAKRVTPAYGLYPYQRQVLHDLLESLAESSRVVAHLPTGAGKTRIACHAAAALLNQYGSEKKVVVWLASSEELCEQAAANLAEAWEHLGNRKAAVHRYWRSASMDLGSLDEGFLVASLPKLWAANQREVGILTRLANRTAGVIFDEAHQAIARTYNFVTEQLATYGPPLIGLTATPGRSGELGDEDYDLAAMFNHCKVAIKPHGHESAVVYLIKQGYLAEPEFISVATNIDARITEPDPGMDYSQDDLETIGRDRAWSEEVVGLTRKALARHRRVMVFCPSVACAEESARAIASEGAWSQAIVAGTPDERRQATIDEFRGSGSAPMALFNYGVLTAGFDAPRTSCIIVARPTASLVLYSQMVGRAMRGWLSGGNRRCQIYTVVDTSLRGFGSVVEAFGNWEEIWRTTSS